MSVEFDSFKRIKTLAERGLDFKLATEVFSSAIITIEDVRKPYGEVRLMTIGLLETSVVIVVWTQRGERRRIISMRKANEREITKYAQHLD
jgi:uncharacterized DUF497 family protein